MTLDKMTEIKILNNLKAEGFKITGYYEYEHIVNIVGDLYRPGIFEIPIKISIEIVKTQIDVGSIRSFINFSTNISAQKITIFSAVKRDELELNIQQLLSLHRVEYIGGSKLEAYLKEREPSDEEIQEYENLVDILSPLKTASFLPELAIKIIPSEINTILQGSKKSWEIFEDAVHVCFLSCLDMDAEQWGHKRRFETDPEGIIFPPLAPYAILYDCKSAAVAYRMNIGDQRAVIEYINDNKEIIKVRDRVELLYFLIIGPLFEGDVETRRDNVYTRTGVNLFFFEAQALSMLSMWAHHLPLPFKRIIDLRDILKGNPVINTDRIEAYIKTFDEANKERY